MKKVAKEWQEHRLTIDDFNGHWGDFKAYVVKSRNENLAKVKQAGQEAFTLYFVDMVNPYTNEQMRLQ